MILASTASILLGLYSARLIQLNGVEILKCGKYKLGISHCVLFTYSYYFSLSFVAAPELVRNFQENQKKVSLALLEKAKDICSKYGV